MRHGTLKYQWIRYLSTENVPDEFWSQLLQKLLQELRSVDNYIGSKGRFRLPEHLRFVPKTIQDHEEQPLLPDCECNTHENIYVSTEYAEDLDYPILRKLGVTDLSMTEFVHRLEYDVGLDQRSRWKRSPDETNWHEQIATVLLQQMDRSPTFKLQVDTIALVPLLNNSRQWAPARGATIFFPTCRGIDIPRDLPLSLVNPDYLESPNMIALFESLGISECLPERIFPLIKNACRSSKWTLGASREHIKFIYWNFDRLTLNELHNPTMIFTDENKKKWPHNKSSWIYHVKSTNEDTYQAVEIFGRSIPFELQHEMHFLSPMYYDYFETCDNRNNKSGIVWLEDFLNLKSTPCIRERKNPLKLSPEIKYIARERPEKLLGVLKADWSRSGPDQAWLTDFKAVNAHVPILNSEAEMPLSETYLPLPKLRAIVSRLKLEDDFGFVEEVENVNELDFPEWTFLRSLGVGMEENLGFWIRLLKNARRANCVDVKVTAEIYTNLQRFCTDLRDKITLKYVILPRREYLEY
jgi:hypothetical protein